MSPCSRYKTFPADTLFTQLVHCAVQRQGPAFHDPAYRVTADYPQLIHDVLHMRGKILDTLPSSSLHNSGILTEDRSFILLLAPNSYEFLVGCLAILSVGGVVVPLTSAILPEEAVHFLGECRANLLMAGSKDLETASSCLNYAHERGFSAFQTLPIQIEKCTEFSMTSLIDQSLTISSSRPGLVIFTSGSTGPPKGVVLPRACFLPGPFRKEEDETFSAHSPVHWAGGVTKLIRMALEGVRLQFIPYEASAAVFWEYLRQRQFTIFSAVPLLLVRLKTYYERELANLPPVRLKEYVEGVRSLKMLRTGSAVPASDTLQFWDRMWGQSVVNAYACTEAGGMMTATSGARKTSSIGKPLPATCLKLSEGDHGEILLKSPRMILRYLNNRPATEAAFDEDGYYKTGDLGHLEDDDYIFDGRASSDFIRVDGYKISILEVERALMALDYVAEAYVVPVADVSYGQNAAAIIRLCYGSTKQEVSLQKLWDNLRQVIPIYMLPTMLRVLFADEVLPELDSGKIGRATLEEKYFNFTEINSDRVEVCRVTNIVKLANNRPWDWAGLQRTEGGCLKEIAN